MTETLDFTTIFDLIIECGKCLIDCAEFDNTTKNYGFGSQFKHARFTRHRLLMIYDFLVLVCLAICSALQHSYTLLNLDLLKCKNSLLNSQLKDK